MADKLLTTLKLSLRVDGSDDDDILNRNLIAAESYVKGAIGETGSLMKDFYELPETQTLYETAVIAIASSYYTYRSASMTGRVNNVDLTSNSIIAQLRGKYNRIYQERIENGS